MLPLHLTPVYGQRQVFRHHAVNVDHLDARRFQIDAKVAQRVVSVQLCPVQQPPRPRKDGRDRVRARLVALLVFTIVSGHRACTPPPPKQNRVAVENGYAE